MISYLTSLQITKLKIDSNPFAKGFRDSSRLTDMERETMETLMHNHSYIRPPMFSTEEANQRLRESMSRGKECLFSLNESS